MRANSGREIALGHLLTSWEYILKALQSGNANIDDYEYDYHKTLFEKSLNYVEGYDLRYKEDGILHFERDKE